MAGVLYTSGEAWREDTVMGCSMDQGITDEVRDGGKVKEWKATDGKLVGCYRAGMG